MKYNLLAGMAALFCASVIICSCKQDNIPIIIEDSPDNEQENGNDSHKENNVYPPDPYGGGIPFESSPSIIYYKSSEGCDTYFTANSHGQHVKIISVQRFTYDDVKCEFNLDKTFFYGGYDGKYYNYADTFYSDEISVEKVERFRFHVTIAPQTTTKINYKYGVGIGNAEYRSGCAFICEAI